MGALPWVRADDIRPYEAQHRKAGKCADERTGKMAPSEPTYVGPPPSLREALGWGILQVSASFEIRAGGTPHLLPIHYYFLPSKNRPIGFREE